MYLVGKINVISTLPEKFKRLNDIAYNLWWTWNPEAIDLYREIDLELWEKVDKNPVRFLQEVSQKKLQGKLLDVEYLTRLDKVIASFDSYMSEKNTWFSQNHSELTDKNVAYFSAEYGLSEVLPIYSGGLGVLSGDHCKSASDLGIPFTAIGLFYKQGYFSQRINKEGWQETCFNDLNISQLPMLPALNSNGEQVRINITFAGRTVYAIVWKVQIGRINLYLMDTDVAENSPADRSLTSRLYGGDQETRIQQEIFLGIGGIRVLDALGIQANVYHMNEGHSSFMGLELIRKLINEKHLNFSEAMEVVANSSIFTTHTPVPAGNDVFPLFMMDKYFGDFWGQLGLSRHDFFELGLKKPEDQNFNMTVLALTLAGRKNGVSRLHGAVSRKIFGDVWPEVPEDDVPITYVTNGIHTLTWLSPKIKDLYDKYLETDWKKKIYSKETFTGIDSIPDEELWATHVELKNKLITFVRDRLKKQKLANGESMESVRQVDSFLDPNALTIGFARRFATYKRANLIFRNLARIQKILNNPERPMQIIFAGKAHPADGPAHDVIKNINDIAKMEGFYGKVILLENYNMTVARNLVQGVDVWMNNPRRPLEASGTSGQKVCINGVINFSILDGWWCEGYNGENGWVIGDESEFDNEHIQDNTDSESIYDTLEQNIIPLFYNVNEKGVPTEWVRIMKNSISSLAWNYSTDRMVKEYTGRMYVPAITGSSRICADNYSLARSMSGFRDHLNLNWPNVQLFAEKSSGDLKNYKTDSCQEIYLSSTVCLGNIDPANVIAEVYYGTLSNGKIENAQVAEMHCDEKTGEGTYRYSINLKIDDGGEYGYTFRITPKHEYLINRFDTGLIKWIK
ncbi:alpha-glucan family phosphorylase [Ruminiclostridium cellulolyticum]|uniref:Alpha-glucan phosphorylase n=1 Tax=Ruminiclostridium cellulolyticum (strain ATCC 35319 / DSM 5812 / JCM 6584 / H10) TaxID=394503 RepID=B8I4Q3_RUMCH|nr:alpha-glucan family phosphorylase [Ruminiclostridium cellulolyticum]ACL76557.1 alpha-glucan phosphorylase [Ruminiclostridium cellulolyticum H10]